MKTIEIQLYKFDELSEAAQETAIFNQSDINVDYDWWDSVYEDAKNVGLVIDGFVLDYGKINATFENGGEDTARAIIAEHGKECDTYKLAEQYLSAKAEILTNMEDIIDDENSYSYELEGDMEQLSDDFLVDLKGEYLSILQKEFEYLTSKEQIIETIKSNDYDFTEDGDIY